MRVRIQHLTRYRDAVPAALGPHVVRPRPADHGRSRTLSYALEITPTPELRWQRDPWNDWQARQTFEEHVRAETLAFGVGASFDLARSQIEPGAGVPPWFVDRLLRNLLVDVSGNTHRTEPCIDDARRPRALTAMLAARPYQQPLVRWGSQLHDRFATAALPVARPRAARARSARGRPALHPRPAPRDAVTLARELPIAAAGPLPSGHARRH